MVASPGTMPLTMPQGNVSRLDNVTGINIDLVGWSLTVIGQLDA